MLKVIPRSFIAIAVMLCAGLGHAAPTYWTVTPALIHGGSASAGSPGDAGGPGQNGQPPSSPEQPPGTPAQPPGIAFNPGPGGGLLPDASVGDPYSFDFSTITTITGGSGSLDDVIFTLTGSLPGGILLTSTGKLEGTPTGETPLTGQSFTLVGTYQDTSTQQQFTIKVGKQYLKAIAISAGVTHSCAITPQGALKCWGGNWAGQLGDGTDEDRLTPIQVQGLESGVTNVSANGDNTCAVQNGALKCWGALQESSTPTLVPGLTSGIAKVIAGTGGAMICAINTSNNLYCWGWSTWTVDSQNKPVWSMRTAPVGIDSAVTDVSPGSTTCYVKGGAVLCWGDNWANNLGINNPTLTEVALIQKVTPSGLGSGVTAISSTGSYACAIQGGAVKCWGIHPLAYSTTPAQIAGLNSGVTSLSAGGDRVCAIHNAIPKCWGKDNTLGILGIGNGSDGLPKDGKTPSSVVGLESGVSHISSGDEHACAIHNGTAKCWGWNNYGQLGNKKFHYGDWSEAPEGVEK